MSKSFSICRGVYLFCLISLRISWCRSAFSFNSRRSCSVILSSLRTLPFVRWASNPVFLPSISPGLLTALFFAETLEPLFGDIYILLLGLRSLFFETVQDVDDVLNLLQIEDAVPSSR